jgi:hypothetical protein
VVRAAAGSGLDFAFADLAEMLSVADIAALFGVEPKTVSMWRLRTSPSPASRAGIRDGARSSVASASAGQKGSVGFPS